MSENDTVGMSAVSADELEQTEGGIVPLLFGLVGIGATVGGFLVAKSLQGGGGEALPGLNNLVTRATIVGAISAGRP